MGEGDVGKGGNSKTKLIVGIVVAVMVIAGVVAVYFFPQPEDTMPIPPSLLFSITENNYTHNVTISHIIDEQRVNITTWTNITNLYYIVSNGTINLGAEDLANYINKKLDYRILESGNFIQIISDNSSFIKYIDSDSNHFLSIGDTIQIDKNIMAQNDTALFLIIVYYGNLEGKLSQQRFIAIDGVAIVSPYESRRD